MAAGKRSRALPAACAARCSSCSAITSRTASTKESESCCFSEQMDGLSGDGCKCALPIIAGYWPPIVGQHTRVGKKDHIAADNCVIACTAAARHIPTHVHFLVAPLQVNSLDGPQGD